VLGGAGMLGNALCRVGTSFPEIEVHATIRKQQKSLSTEVPAKKIRIFDFGYSSTEEFSSILTDYDYVVNAIGLIPQKFNQANLNSVDQIYLFNTILPKFLNEQSASIGYRYIQIGTDCVFDGQDGKYTESSLPNAKDHYGLSKAIAESALDKAQVLRCSIIGKELSTAKSLLSWFLALPRNSTIQGFTNHFWNGLTVEHFGRIVFSIITKDESSPGLQHVVPANIVSKFQLLKYFAEVFSREDVHILPTETEKSVNRSLSTEFPEKNNSLWRSAGMDKPLTIETMIKDFDIIWKQRRN